MLQLVYSQIGDMKMKLFRKTPALLMALVMVLTASACGKSEPAGNDLSNTTENVSDDKLFDDEPLLNNEETTTEQESATVESTTKKQESTTKSAQSTASTTKKEEVTESSEITVVKREYTWNSVKQIVYYPDDIKSSNKIYPAIVWANGTGCPPSMYESLLKEIALGGYIVIANEETMAADGTAQIASIDFIIAQNDDESSIFYKKVNTDKIGAIGHSQGGRSSVNAAAADSRIDCVISLAGSNYTEEAELLSTPTFFIAGERDMIVDAGIWIEPAYEICKGPAVYASLKGAIHTRCCTNPEDYSGYAIKWLDAWLKNDSKALNTFKDGGELSKDSNWKDFACKKI